MVEVKTVSWDRKFVTLHHDTSDQENIRKLSYTSQLLVSRPKNIYLHSYGTVFFWCLSYLTVKTFLTCDWKFRSWRPTYPFRSQEYSQKNVFFFLGEGSSGVVKACPNHLSLHSYDFISSHIVYIPSWWLTNSQY